MLVVLNNKCNFTKEQFLEYQKSLNEIKSNNTLILCPSSCYLPLFNLNNFILGAQNESCYEEGSYTGEISAAQLQSLGVRYCIVGHYERRKYFNETNEIVNKKIINLLKQNIIPILCIEEYDDEILQKEICTCLKNIEKDELEKVIIAYEPTVSIGTGNILNIDHLVPITKKIKQCLPNNNILYGGGITEENIQKIKDLKYIDGYLLGNISLDIDKLNKFLQELEK